MQSEQNFMIFGDCQNQNFKFKRSYLPKKSWFESWAWTFDEWKRFGMCQFLSAKNSTNFWWFRKNKKRAKEKRKRKAQKKSASLKWKSEPFLSMSFWNERKRYGSISKKTKVRYFCKYPVERANLENRQNFYVIRAENEWNIIPGYIVTQKTEGSYSSEFFVLQNNYHNAASTLQSILPTSFALTYMRFFEPKVPSKSIIFGICWKGETWWAWEKVANITNMKSD